jgi:hypothetical protein
MQPLVSAQPDPIDTAIQDGLGWLAGQQDVDDGGWGEPESCERVAYTGLAVLKFNTYAIENDWDPLDPDYVYYDQVSGGLAYIEDHKIAQAIEEEPAGDPDGDGDGIGVYWDDGCGTAGGHEIYNTGIAMMALASSGHPELYGDLLQDAVDFMAWAQADPGCVLHRGGWRYGYDYCDSDNSNSGYATLGLGFAQSTPPYGFGLTVPQFVKDELSIWIDVIQDDTNGCSLYSPSSSWPNILKQGNLLYEMALVGDTVEDQRVKDALDCLEQRWDQPGCGEGWEDHRQAMFTMMKGFEALCIDLIDLDGDGVPEHDWFAEVSQHLVDTQQPDGSWPVDCWGGGQVLSTAWALLTLEKAVPPIDIPVPVDIKPTSCRNPLNVKSKGVLPVAILGSGDLDVEQIDPATILLEGVSPLRWALEDVATPFEPYIGKQDAFDCTEDGPDGFQDLTFKFDEQEIVAALGEVNDGDVLVLQLTGNLKEEFGGTPIFGEDVVVILKKGKK